MKNAWLDELQAESRLLEEIATTSNMQVDTTLMAESEEELKSLLMRVKEESEKPGLNSIFKKQEPWHPVRSHHRK